VSHVRGPATQVRLAIGAALCVLPLGLVWSTSPGFRTAGYVIYGDCGYSIEQVCTSDTYVPGSYFPGSHIVGAQASARVFLVVAAVGLAYAASRTRTPATRRLARAATGAIGVALALALAQRAVLTVACLAVTLVLVVPLVLRSPRTGSDPGVFVPDEASR
jgi:hypothetical protein